MQTNKFIQQIQQHLQTLSKHNTDRVKLTKDTPDTKKHTNINKSSSKSTKKSNKSYNMHSSRKSIRLNNSYQLMDYQHIEIDKQPIWNHRKLKIQNDQSRIPKKSRYIKVTKQYQKSNYKNKINFTQSPSYQFQGMAYNQPISKISIQIQEQQPRKQIEQHNINKIQQYGTNFTFQNNLFPQPHKNKKTRTIQNAPKLNESKLYEPKLNKPKLNKQYSIINNPHQQKQQRNNIQQQQCQQQIDINAPLTKLQQSLLTIVRLIDENFIFQKSFRTTKGMKLTDIIKYICEFKGFFVNRQMFDTIIDRNPKLYNIIKINGVIHVKTPSITEKDIPIRQLQTRKRIIKSRVSKNFLSDALKPISIQ